MAKDTEKKSKKNTATLYDIKAPGQGFLTIEGDIVDSMGDAYIVRHRRSGSSKWQRRSIPKKNIIVMPAEGVGRIVYSGTQNAIRLRKATVEGPDKNNPGFIKVIDEKGAAMLVRSEYMDATTVTEIDAPASSGEKKKSKKSK